MFSFFKTEKTQKQVSPVNEPVVGVNTPPKKQQGFNTICVHAGSCIPSQYGDIISPIHLSTATTKGWNYPRLGSNPNQNALVQKICKLESAEFGVVFNSGMAAIQTTLFTCMMKDFKPNESSRAHCILSRCVYGGTLKLVEKEFPSLNFDVTFIDSNDPKDFEKAITKNTKLIYVETIANPCLQVIDLREIAAIAKKHGIISIVDNTFATPVLCQPIKLGIDLVIHSATKFLNGHSDVTAGVVVGKREIIEDIKKKASIFGGVLQPMECYLLERGIKTLALRIKQQTKNAQQIAEFLSKHNKIKKVYYPGLPFHQGHEIAKQILKGFGSMISFDMSSEKDAFDFVNKLKHIKSAVSLGGVETILCFPAYSSHGSMDEKQRLKLGITNSLIRLSVGIEDVEDLIDELSKALE